MQNLVQRPGGMPVRPSDSSLKFAAGDQIFHQGDPGGDLFFIEEGSVEIFTEKAQEKVVLSEMTKGEIIGVMTCLTSDPRMASARAKTDVVCKKVPHDRIRKVLEALPNWMKIVLKEFSVRLGHMNVIYSEAVLTIKRLEGSQISNVYLGALVASAFGTLAEYLAKRIEDTKIVVVEDVLAKLEPLLNMRREEIDRIFAVLLEAGLLKIEIEPERKQTVVKLDVAQRLLHFAQFVRESKHGNTKRFIRARFSNKETRVLSSLVKLAQRLKLNLDETCKMARQEVASSLERATGVVFEREALEKAVKLKLLAIEGRDEREMLVFKPIHLGRSVACIEAVRKFMALDERHLGHKKAVSQ